MRACVAHDRKRRAAASFFDIHALATFDVEFDGHLVRVPDMLNACEERVKVLESEHMVPRFLTVMTRVSNLAYHIMTPQGLQVKGSLGQCYKKWQDALHIDILAAAPSGAKVVPQSRTPGTQTARPGLAPAEHKSPAFAPTKSRWSFEDSDLKAAVEKRRVRSDGCCPRVGCGAAVATCTLWVVALVALVVGPFIWRFSSGLCKGKDFGHQIQSACRYVTGTPSCARGVTSLANAADLAGLDCAVATLAACSRLPGGVAQLPLCTVGSPFWFN